VTPAGRAVIYELLPSYSLIYSNYSPGLRGQVAAVQVSIESNAAITEIAWWGTYEPGAPVTVSSPSFAVDLYADESGSPGPQPIYSLLLRYPGTDTGLVVADGSSFSGQHILEYVATVPALPLAPSRSYWISIADSDLRTAEWLWSRSVSRGPVAVRSEVGDYAESWMLLPRVERPAFRLGTSSASSWNPVSRGRRKGDEADKARGANQELVGEGEGRGC